MKDNFSDIVSIVKKEKPNSEQMAIAKQKIQYHIYDAPTDNIFSIRNNWVNKLVDAVDHPSIKSVPTTIVHNEEQADEYYGMYMEAGYEGGMIRTDDPYEQKRSNTLLKRKDFDDEEFTIVGFENGKGNWANLPKKIMFLNPKTGEHEPATLKGSMAYAQHVKENATDYIGKQVTVQFFGYTPDNALRFPVAIQLHKDTRW